MPLAIDPDTMSDMDVECALNDALAQSDAARCLAGMARGRQRRHLQRIACMARLRRF